MTDDRLNAIRVLMLSLIDGNKDAKLNPRDVLALLDMIDRLREEIESSQDKTVEDLC